MKQLIILTTTAIVLLSSCGGGDKSAQLEKLKADRTKLNEQIALLEKEVGATGGDSAKATDNSKLKQVSLEAVTLKPFAHYIDVQGKVDGDENVTVTVKMAGIIARIAVEEGASVSKGQILAELENDAITKGIDEVKVQLDLAGIMYGKQKNLWDQKIGTEVQFLTAKAQKESLEKRMASLQEQLDMTRIKAPIAGTLEEFGLKIGQAAMPGMSVARVINPSKLKVVAEVAEGFASKVKVGNDVKIEFPDLNKIIDSKLSFTSKYISPLSRSFVVESKLANSDDYRANMVAVVKVNDYKKDKTFVVPVNMIQNSEEGTFVLAAEEKGGKKLVKKLMVTKGLDYNGNAEILSGLSEGDQLIVKGYQDLNEGQEIKY